MFTTKLLDNYFKNMFKKVNPKIVLDDEQIKAIVADDTCALILAGAGTGKTTTMAAKVKYLVDIKKIDPRKILVMSYTKKATKELENLIVDEFGINAHVTTFHSLGLEYIRRIFKDRKCIVIDYNEREKIFYNYFKSIFNDKEKIKNIVYNFSNQFVDDELFSKYFINNYELYSDYDLFFNSYKNHKVDEANNIGLKHVVENWIEKQINSEVIITINGEAVKSAGEAVIANFLYKHGIEYSYEKVYSEIMEDRMTYRPDFTLDLGGTPVYLEYFGLDDEKYNRIKKKKQDFHAKYKNKFIYIEKLPLDKIESFLDKYLRKLGFVYKDRSYLQTFNQILDNNKLSNVFKFKNFLYSCVQKIKEYEIREKVNSVIDNYINTSPKEEQESLKFQKQIIAEFYNFYQNSLRNAENYGFDYSDLIYYSNKYLNRLDNDHELDFEYIIIDEYQDISQWKYLLAKNTAKRTSAKLFAVGDDWQSIYSFSGSKIEYIYDFEKYFEGAKIYKISKTYRNSQELINITGKFIEKNKHQIKKELMSDSHIDNPIIIKEFDSLNEYGERDLNKEYECLKQTINEIHMQNKNRNILILARTNKTIKRIFDDKEFVDDLDTKIKYLVFNNLNIDGMSMHKSKGLTFDEVILIGLNNYFPLNHKDEFWLINILKNKLVDEGISFPEERRLFYVALTRTKNHVYILKDINTKLRSPFIDELEKIYKGA